MFRRAWNIHTDLEVAADHYAGQVDVAQVGRKVLAAAVNPREIDAVVCFSYLYNSLIEVENDRLFVVSLSLDAVK